MLKYSPLLAAALLLNGCSNNSQQLYVDQVQASGTPIAHSFQEAVRLSPAVQLPVNRGLFPTRWEISATDPRIASGAEHSNYRLFEFLLRKGQRYEINVISMCNNMCMGLAKTALKPKAVVLDMKGNVVAANLAGPNALTIDWTGAAPADGVYLLMVAADNRAPGEQVSVINTQVPGHPTLSMPIGMASAPFGKVIAYVQYPSEQ
ncbi:hypothetical protein HX870_15075 [Pseudomonas gingeri]|uniref:hypothetical protein n=1 Tax=Pseudomonas gingeri TaxID=117681 RepID=UPI0015A15183|nr:hypothetical protein [Pseudomonas gingeri]NWD68923.1 hypothetical protein [Pseudomonas gingeri]